MIYCDPAASSLLCVDAEHKHITHGYTHRIVFAIVSLINKPQLSTTDARSAFLCRRSFINMLFSVWQPEGSEGLKSVWHSSLRSQTELQRGYGNSQPSVNIHAEACRCMCTAESLTQLDNGSVTWLKVRENMQTVI